MNAWEPIDGPSGGPITALTAIADRDIVATTADGMFASNDSGASWAPIEAPPGTGIVTIGGEIWFGIGAENGTTSVAHPTRGAQRVITAIASHGDRIWMGERTITPGFDTALYARRSPSHHHGNRVTDRLLASTDGGATWVTVQDRIAAQGLAIDRHGRVWIASPSGLDVIDSDGAKPRRALDRPATCVAVDGAECVIVGTAGPAYLSQDGERFSALPTHTIERGAWGVLEGEAAGFRILRRAPDGTVWAATDGGVVRLASVGARWESINLGLLVVPYRGPRPGHVHLNALAFAADGTAFAATHAHGLFRRGQTPARAKPITTPIS